MFTPNSALFGQGWQRRKQEEKSIGNSKVFCLLSKRTKSVLMLLSSFECFMCHSQDVNLRRHPITS